MLLIYLIYVIFLLKLKFQMYLLITIAGNIY